MVGYTEQNLRLKRRINTASRKRILQTRQTKRACLGDVDVAMTPKMTSALLKVTGFIMELPTMAEATSARPYVLLADESHQS